MSINAARPRGAVAQALLGAARAAGQAATVRDLCARAQVGFGAGSYTASRLVSAGDLLVVGSHAPPPGTPPRAGRPAALLLHRDLAATAATGSAVAAPGVPAMRAAPASPRLPARWCDF